MNTPLSYLICLQQPEQMVRKIAEFLGHSVTSEQVSEVVRRTRFNVMKRDSSVNYSWWDELGLRLKSESQFMRKGTHSVVKNAQLCYDCKFSCLCVQ